MVSSRNTSVKTVSGYSETSQSEDRWEGSPNRRGTTRRKLSGSRGKRQKNRIEVDVRIGQDTTVVKLLSRPQENLYKRVGEYEKLAKQLEKDLEEKEHQEKGGWAELVRMAK